MSVVGKFVIPDPKGRGLSCCVSPFTDFPLLTLALLLCPLCHIYTEESLFWEASVFL